MLIVEGKSGDPVRVLPENSFDVLTISHRCVYIVSLVFIMHRVYVGNALYQRV